MTPRPSASLRATTAAAAALALLLTGCSTEQDATGAADQTPDPAGTTTSPESADDAAASTTAAGDASAADFPVTIPGPAGDVVIEERPERIVSLSPSATEILFAIGAGDQVVAADEFSTFPAEAPTTDLSGFEPNVEAIVGYEPDLVVISNDINDLVAGLGELDIPVLVNPAPADLESGYAGMADLGLATGHVDETAAAVQQLRDGVAAALEDAPDSPVRVYHELDETLFAASSASFIGSVYSELGAVNVADEADAEGTGYPQLTEEAVVESNPQLIVISDQAAYTAEDVAARPGWSEVDAVRNGNIVAVDADISSRWGPRLPQLVQALADAMAEVPAGEPVGR
ncbi:ABC transporter substrate-binding protein [Ornithinimicrobium pekingense]|uniref:ABC transporter substrate-binding protein n=1 Tax=Ornithinimicrobium pekingense TaxID=384677 RepID=A0ABQ2F8W4_9MICO|nr:ABC transporter substrate-binding protein [Ornithinimicrobium pekingense]GGK72959.1 ABC transporter substrate-binding protein [Ornithinimicrobium pekingense]